MRYGAVLSRWWDKFDRNTVNYKIIEIIEIERNLFYRNLKIKKKGFFDFFPRKLILIKKLNIFSKKLSMGFPMVYKVLKYDQKARKC